MNKKIPHSLTWSLDSSVLEKKLYAWYVNPLNPNVQVAVFELYEDDFYVVCSVVDSNTGEFKLDAKEFKVFSEQAARNAMSDVEKEGFHCVVNWWNDIYSKEGLESVQEESDLYELVLIFRGMIDGRIGLSLGKSSRYKKSTKEEEEKEVAWIIEWIRKNSIRMSDQEIKDLSCEELLKWVNENVSEPKISTPGLKGKLFLLDPLFQNIRSIFYKSVKEGHKELFDKLLSFYNLKSLDPGQDYLPVLFALDILKNRGDDYFISKIIEDIMFDEKYSIRHSRLASKLKPLLKDKLVEYNNEYSNQLLAYDFS